MLGQMISAVQQVFTAYWIPLVLCLGVSIGERLLHLFRGVGKDMLKAVR